MQYSFDRETWPERRDTVPEVAGASSHYFTIDPNSLRGNLIFGQRTQTGASTVSNTITVQNWANGQLGITLQDAPVDPLPPEERGLPIRQGDQRPQTLVNGDGLAYYDWGSTSYAADGSLTNGVAEANFADVLYAPSSLGSVLYGYGGNDVLGGGADRNFGGTT